MRANGIQWDRSRVDLVDSLAHCSGLALGVSAVENIEQGDVLCVIPKAACLSTKTTAIAGLLEAEQLGGGACVVCCSCRAPRGRAAAK